MSQHSQSLFCGTRITQGCCIILPCAAPHPWPTLVLQEMILSRALVLEATTNVLMDYTARRAYDRSLQIEIPYTHLPGALFIPTHPQKLTLAFKAPHDARLVIVDSFRKLLKSDTKCRRVCPYARGWGRAAGHQVGQGLAGG